MARANDSGAAEEDKGLMSDPITRLNAALEGRYQIDREVGEGGMATVFLADDLRHERKVALKVLKPELAAVVGADRFLAEIKTTAKPPASPHPTAFRFRGNGLVPVLRDALRRRGDAEGQAGPGASASCR